jgi:hypothetical protein
LPTNRRRTAPRFQSRAVVSRSRRYSTARLEETPLPAARKPRCLQHRCPLPGAGSCSGWVSTVRKQPPSRDQAVRRPDVASLPIEQRCVGRAARLEPDPVPAAPTEPFRAAGQGKSKEIGPLTPGGACRTLPRDGFLSGRCFRVPARLCSHVAVPFPASRSQFLLSTRAQARIACGIRSSRSREE